MIRKHCQKYSSAQEALVAISDVTASAQSSKEITLQKSPSSASLVDNWSLLSAQWAWEWDEAGPIPELDETCLTLNDWLNR